MRKTLALTEFPNLFVIADTAAGKMQKRYFALLYLQYFLLTAASGLTLFSALTDRTTILVGYLSLLLLASLFSIILAMRRPNQDWYSMRALAESCKTITWRFVMRAEPFEASETIESARLKFADRLHGLLSVHGRASTALVQSADFGDIVTLQMEEIRDLTLEEHKSIYLENRIRDQLHWYQKKAAYNKRMANLFSVIVVLVYLGAIGLTITQLLQDHSGSETILWVSEPLLVLAAAILGIAQAKRYAELATSYTLTALEIQKLELDFKAVEDEAAMAEFVSTAETAFSREHIQWLARQA